MKRFLKRFRRRHVLGALLALAVLLPLLAIPIWAAPGDETTSFGVEGYNSGDEWNITTSKALKVKVDSLDTAQGGYSIRITLAKGMKLSSYLWNTADPENWPVGEGVQGSRVPMDNSTNDYFNGGSVSLDDDGNTVLIYNTNEGCSSMILTDKILVQPDELVTYGSDNIPEAIKFELLDSTGAVVSDTASLSVDVKIAKDQLTNSSYGAKRLVPGTRDVLLYEADYYRKGLSSIGSGTVTITLGIPECVDNITKLMDISAGGSGTEIPDDKIAFDPDNHILTITGYEVQKGRHFKCGIYGDISDTATIGKTYYDDKEGSITKFVYTDTYDHEGVTYDMAQGDFTGASRYAVIIAKSQDALMMTDYKSPTYGDFPDGYPSLFGLIRNFYTSSEQSEDQMVTWEFDEDTLDIIGVFFPLDPTKTNAITVTDVVFDDGTEKHGLNLSFSKYTTAQGKAYSTRYLNVADLKAGDPTIPDAAKYIRSVTANCGKFSEGFATDNGYGKPVGYFNQAVIDAGVTKEIEYRFRVNNAEPQKLYATYDPDGETACLHLTNATYSDDARTRQTESTSFKAGETIYMSTRVSAGSGLLSTYEPRLYLVVPQWMSFDPSQLRAKRWITSYSSSAPISSDDYFNDEDIKYTYSYVKNAAGENFTCYEFYIEGESVGSFLETPDPAYVRWSGQNGASIVFEYPLSIEDTANTQTIDYNDYLFTGKGNIRTGNFLTATGHASGYNHADIWDFDGDGNRSETDVVTSVPDNSNITILDNMNITVSGYLTHQGSSDAVNPYDPGSDGSNEVNVVEFMPSDHADYHVIISNTLVSIGQTCSVNAYIPIPNGKLEGDTFAPTNTDPSHKWYQFDDYKWPMELRDLIQNVDQNTFDIIYYLDSITSLDSGTGEPVSETMIANPASLTDDELDRVVLVEIRSKSGVRIPSGRYEFNLPLKVGVDETQATAADMNLEKNIFRPRYHREGGIGAVWVNGNYVAARLAVSSIGGNVFNDVNGNGHWDEGEDGLPNVTVQLFDSSDSSIATKATDADGKYSFTSEDNGGVQLPAGSYRIKVVNPDTGDYVFTRHVTPTQANYKVNSEALMKENHAYAELELTLPYNGVLSGYQEYQNAGLFIDKVGGGSEGNSPDGIPDACEVRVNYDAVKGAVKPGQKTFQYFFESNGNGGYKRELDLNITAPPTVTPNTGCVLDHWENDKDDETNKDGRFVFEGVGGGTVITVTAVCEDKYYSISYDSNRPSDIDVGMDQMSEPPKEQSKKKDTPIALSDDVQTCVDTSTDPHTRYTFLGWNTKKDGSGTMYQPGDNYSEDADVVLYAQWDREALQPYEINHMVEKKDSVDWTARDNYEKHNSQLLYGRIGDPTNGSAMNIEGFEFVLELTKADPPDYTIIQEDPATGKRSWVNLYYKRNSYTIEFDTNGGPPIGSITGKYEADITAPEDPERPGYVFLGWDREIPETMPAENITIKAQWQQVHTITFKDHDGTVLGTTTGVEGSVIDVPSVPDREGYRYTGWDRDLPEDNLMPDSDMTLTAQYAPIVYTISYTLNGGTVENNPTTYTIESDDITLENPSKPGFAFQGWSGTGLDGVTKNVTIRKGSIGNRSYTANWPSTSHYKVEHYKEKLDGTYPSTPDETETRYGSTGVDTVAVARSYEHFEAQAFDQAEIADTSGGDDPTVIKIYYKRAMYSVTFVDEDGTTVLKEKTSYRYETAADMIEKPADPSKDPSPEYTYKFAGWSPEITDVTGNVTYTASYTAVKNKYLITFKNHDGTVLQTGEVEYGTVPRYTGETPTRQETDAITYTFSDWAPLIKSVDGEQTYTAQFSEAAKQYTVKWLDDDGETVLYEKAVEYGTQMPSFAGDPDPPKKDATAEYSYEFKEWVPDVTPEEATVTRNVTYTASYTAVKNKYLITFKNYDGTVLQTGEVEYGTVPTYEGAIPTRQETSTHTYTFSGWEPVIDSVTEAREYIATFTEKAKSAIVYYYTRGEDSTWKQKDGKGAYFTVKRNVDDMTTFSHFTGIQVDGKDVSADRYTAESGSVKLALKPSYIDSLAIGEHTLKANFDDGSAETTFEVIRASTNDPTDDPSGDLSGDDSDSGDEDAGSGSSGSSGSSRGRSSRTGDEHDMLAIAMALMLAAMGAGAIPVIRTRRR